ncbi:MAG TPA: bifunctional diaminohydroxyphosphoribosylaminopyrimidine deaminase/5-amino-6-(5-phosphoribosylamino)uracil reductase RibD [Candidatus Brocadiia bacterium]|nr:bifunctional diaminohydroxyphosphoribosylaminopyrimidine deaminase/5-amino-6-(5-phosphoribosylamino)uracil reductase RibD [Candidatus Brocadiales bacterium]
MVDENFMRIALDLAEEGRGRVEPNPVVGAVIVNNGEIVSQSYHEYFGGPHAEVNAIIAAGDRCRGATLYVTLEPCTHFGKTPPCVDAIKSSGIKRVVVATTDPNPVNNGKGIKLLREVGIEVVERVLEEPAKKLNAPFFKLITTKTPYVIAKWAMTLDGKIATRTGDSRWISSEESRQYVHKKRAMVDAVVVGIRTVLRDDPLLTCRIKGGRNPKRIVVDGRAELPLHSRLVQTVKDADVFVATTSAAPTEHIMKLETAGCKIIELKSSPEGVDILSLIQALGMMNFTNVLIEGGGTLLGTFFDKKLVDRVMVFIAPHIVGGAGAKTPVLGVGVERITDSLRLEDILISRFGNDILIEGTVGK